MEKFTELESALIMQAIHEYLNTDDLHYSFINALDRAIKKVNKLTERDKYDNK